MKKNNASYKISKNDFLLFCDKLLKEQYNVIFPIKKESGGKTILIFSKINKSSEIIFPFDTFKDDVNTINSIKEFFFPQTEELLRFSLSKNSIEIDDPIQSKIKNKNVIIGAKPCDFSSLSILDKVFNWDFKDDFFNKQRDNTIIIGIQCTSFDDKCFCTALNITPTTREGSDIFIVPSTEENQMILEIVTSKGEEFFQSKFLKNFNIKELSFEEKEKSILPFDLSQASSSIDLNKVNQWLENNFDSDYFKRDIGLRCLGCGVCAFVCPTCHCFDIVDENNYDSGKRLRNWDSCNFSTFTLHASGHNPRNFQYKRYRQRFFHKFKYYKEKFDNYLCTGCGRCSRYCPVRIDIKTILNDITLFEGPK